MVSSLFNCLICFKQKRASVLEGASPSLKGLDEKSLRNTEDSFDSEPETTKSHVFSTVTPEVEVAPKTVAKKNRALTVSAKRTYTLTDDHTFPSLEHDNEIIIATRAVGLNPIDWKSVDFNFCMPEFPWVNGREMAGVVEAVGASVMDFKVGDRVWTSTYYRDSRAGCFQEYVTVPQHTVCHIPTNLSFESAACLGVAGLTAAMTLWRWLQIPQIHVAKPDAHDELDEYLLVWGGSSVTAQFAIQIASNSGVKIIAVASSKTASMVQALGAAHVVVRDGKTGAEIVAEIREIAGDNVTKAIDLVGTETAQYCLDAFSKEKKCLFAPLAMISSKAVVPANVSVETVEMKQFVLDPESRVHALGLERLLAEGSVRLPEIDVIKGGLDSVQEGLERLKKGDMGGRKLVVSFA